MAIERILLCCMDFRCGVHLNENYLDGKTLGFSNAGSHVKGEEKGMREAIEANKDTIKEIVILFHGSKDKDTKGCAAMNYVYETIKGGGTGEPQFEQNVISDFRGARFNSIQEVEAYNGKVQEKAILKLLKEMGLEGRFNVKVIYLETKEIYKPDGTAHTEKLMDIGECTTEKIKDTSHYQIRGSKTDVAAAQLLGIKDASKKRVLTN